jgi:hypothetical protein
MIPKVILTGNPGGTVIVIKSKNLNIKSYVVTVACNFMIKTLYEKTAKANKNIKNFVDCFWN